MLRPLEKNPWKTAELALCLQSAEECALLLLANFVGSSTWQKQSGREMFTEWGTKANLGELVVPFVTSQRTDYQNCLSHTLSERWSKQQEQEVYHINKFTALLENLLLQYILQNAVLRTIESQVHTCSALLKNPLLPCLDLNLHPGLDLFILLPLLMTGPDTRRGWRLANHRAQGLKREKSVTSWH